MRKIVAGKRPRQGKAEEPQATAPTGGNVVWIMDALQAERCSGQGGGRRAGLRPAGGKLI